jgi:protein-tyrosine phosphatase
MRAALAPLREMGEEELNKWIESQYVKYHHGFYMCSKHLKEIILELAKENAKPMIIHCGAGKDRTGYCIAAILTLIDVEQDLILDEYILTSESYSKKVLNFSLMSTSLNHHD